MPLTASCHPLLLVAFIVMLPIARLAFATSPDSATVVVATEDSSQQSKGAADFLGDGDGDHEEINAAIESLPKAGGTVLLMEGTYDIRRAAGKLGGILIERSNVTLTGQGSATKLVQAPEQDTNVVRIIGSGVGNITIRDLYVDANRDQNSKGKGDPSVSHDRFEFCGIKAYYQVPGGPGGETNHDITIERCTVLNAHRLGIMLEGANMRVLNNVLGNARSDSVEILTGPGQISGNYVEITGPTHVGIGTDRADNILMVNNIVHVKEGGDLDIGFRSWADSQRHVIANNIVTVDPGGVCRKAMDVRGFGAVVTGNNVYSANAEERIRLTISGGNTLVTGNIFENVVIDVNDQTEIQKPILIRNNLFENSIIELSKGNLVADEPVKERVE